MARYVLFPLLILGLGLTSCNESLEDPIPFYQGYFPLQTGKYITYELDSIKYFETVENDTVHYLVKEEIGERFIDLAGDTAFVINRYIRKSETLPWRFDNTWTAKRNAIHAEKVENNLRFLKMVFPPEPGKTWNGSIYLGGLSTVPVSESCNNLEFLEDWEYTYDEVHAPWEVNDNSFDSTCVVLQSGEQNLIEFNQGLEVYALGLGLVYKEFQHYTTQQICPECPWQEKVDCGYEYSLKLIDFN